jgi:hypothetical protein
MTTWSVSRATKPMPERLNSSCKPECGEKPKPGRGQPASRKQKSGELFELPITEATEAIRESWSVSCSPELPRDELSLNFWYLLSAGGAIEILFMRTRTTVAEHKVLRQKRPRMTRLLDHADRLPGITQVSTPVSCRGVLFAKAPCVWF